MTFRMRGDALGPVAFITLCVKSGSKRCVSGVAEDLSVETLFACPLFCSFPSDFVIIWDSFSSEAMVRGSCIADMLELVTMQKRNQP